MRRYEDLDREWERYQAEADEQEARERHADRLADHTPREPIPHSPAPITTPMVVLSQTVLNGPDRDRRDAARVLAELVLEATEP